MTQVRKEFTSTAVTVIQLLFEARLWSPRQQRSCVSIYHIPRVPGHAN